MKTVSRPAQAIVLGLGFFFLLAPIAVVVVMSFSSSELLTFPPQGFSLRWYGAILGDDWVGGLLRSMLLATISATIATVVGSLAAWKFASSKARGMVFIMAVALSPALMPSIVQGVGSFIFYADIGIYGNLSSLILTHTVVGLPYPIGLMTLAFRRLDPNLRLAALSLGAAKYQMVRHVVLPSVVGTALAAWLLAFLASFDEVVITTLILPPGIDSTYPMQLFSLVTQGLSPLPAALATVVLVVSILVAVIGGLRAYASPKVRE